MSVRSDQVAQFLSMAAVPGAKKSASLVFDIALPLDMNALPSQEKLYNNESAGSGISMTADKQLDEKRLS